MVEMISGFNGPYRFLSNFHPSELEIDGVVYPTAEHAFQAAKTLDQSVRREISQLSTPGDAKRFGRKLELRPDWDSVRVSMMADVIGAKFLQNDDLTDLLTQTGYSILIEGNTWHDQFWGICVCDKHGGEGTNYLGTLLMGFRASL